jgi:molecular chaperone HtpG
MADIEQKKTLGFQAEVKQLLHLVTHALYSNKEIFLRELISNASDANDKLRYAALENDKLYEGESALQIKVSADKDHKTLTISDNGIGMTMDEVIANLGTIAHSGTKEFLQALGESKSKDNHMIGQFGVGFYSSFIVADEVTVKTRRAGVPRDQGVLWHSKGEGEFSVDTITKTDHGTEVILHLKSDDEEFLDEWRLESVIKKYSDHIPFEVYLKKKTTVEPEPEADAADDQDKSEKEVKAPEEVETFEVINQATALWTLKKSDIKDEEYKAFYKHISHDYDDPLLWGHNRVEGKLQYTTLLYIPSHAPFDLWHRDAPRGLKLYVQRVFIMDNAEKLLPLYLRFVKGVVDSSDLPLNVSRELLQSNKVIDSIRAANTKRVLGMLEKLAQDDKEKYQKFWDEFGKVLKEGPAEDFANRDAIAKLLRFSTTHDDNEIQSISFDDYVGRMQEKQEKIYYITAKSFAAAKHSPHLEVFRKNKIEVLLLADSVDEWLVSNLNEYAGKSLQSIAKGDVDLGDLQAEEDKKQQETLKETNVDFVERVKKILGDKVKDVRVTNRLTDSPACIVADEHDMSSNIQRMLEAAGQKVPKTQPILELNPEHPIVVKTRDEKNDDQFSEWSYLLFEQAVLAEGGQLDDPAVFVSRMNKLLQG